MLTILKETPQWLAIFKPSGMTVHNEKGEDVVSLLAKQGYEFAQPVHRLDAGTSGVLLLAKTKEASAILHEMFAQRDVEKVYICRGKIAKGEAPVKGEEGRWTWSLTKKAESRKNPRGWAGQRVPCRSAWEILDVRDQQVLFLCFLETGRKHQIRRHAAVAGWPLVGDFRYGPRPETPAEEEQPMHLHAYRLSFDCPFAHEKISIEAQWPSWARDD